MRKAAAFQYWPAAALLATAAAVAGAVAVFFLLREPFGPDGGGLGGEYQWQPPVRQVPAKLLTWREARSWPTGMKHARDLALDADGRVLVAGDQAVAVFDADGKRLTQFDLRDEPQCLAVRPDGGVLVGYLRDIEALPMGGSASTRPWASLEDNSYITNLTVAPSSDVYVADAGLRRVLRFDAMGQLRNVIQPPDANGRPRPFVLRSPTLDLAVAPDGLLRVTHSGKLKIEAYTPDSSREFAWGRAGDEVNAFAGCCNPAYIAILPDGSIVTSEKGALLTIKVFAPDSPADPNGTLRSVIRHETTDGREAHAWPVAADPEGRVWALDVQTATVRLYEHQGESR